MRAVLLGELWWLEYAASDEMRRNCGGKYLNEFPETRWFGNLGYTPSKHHPARSLFSGCLNLGYKVLVFGMLSQLRVDDWPRRSDDLSLFGGGQMNHGDACPFDHHGSIAA